MARPTYALQVAFASSPDDPLAAQVWTDISSRLDVQAGVEITRGRPDEFGDVVPSTLSLVLKNADGALTPGNSASPYWPNVVTGKYIRLGLTWPGGGVNYAPNPTIADIAGWAPGGSVQPALSASTGAAPPLGTHALLIAWGTGGAFPSAGIDIPNLVVGATYTASAYCYVPAGSPSLGLVVAGGPLGGSTSATGVWQRISVTWTATSSTHQVQVWPGSAPTSGQVGRVHALQVELGSVPTTFVGIAATQSWRFTGKVAEWPLAWSGGPALYAETRLTAADALRRPGDDEFRTFLVEDVLDDGPFAFYPLTEGPGSPVANDVSDQGQPPLRGVQAGTGGAIILGESRWTVGGADLPTAPRFYEDRATGAQIIPAGAGNGRFLSATLKAPVDSTTGATIAGFFSGPGGTTYTGTAAAMTALDGSYFSLEKDATLSLVARLYLASTGVTTTFSSGFFAVGPDGWAAVLRRPSPGNGIIDLYWFGVLLGSSAVFSMPTVPTWSEVSVGGRRKDPIPLIASHVQFYNYPVPAAALDSQTWVADQGVGFDNDTTVLRMTKLAGFAGFDLPISVLGYTVGLEADAGPQEIEGNPVEAMQRVARTEGGPLHITGAGELQLQMRPYRFNAAVSLSVAADRLDPGAITFRGDDFGLVNDVTASRADGLVARVVNEASRTRHGRRKGSLETVAATADDQRALAAWSANSYGTERNRVTGVKVSLLNDPALIPSALSMDIGKKLRVTALPPQGPASQVDLFVEGWTERIGENEWSLAFNTSPAEVFDVWQIGVPGRSEIGTTTRIGY